MDRGPVAKQLAATRESVLTLCKIESGWKLHARWRIWLLRGPAGESDKAHEENRDVPGNCRVHCCNRRGSTVVCSLRPESSPGDSSVAGHRSRLPRRRPDARTLASGASCARLRIGSRRLSQRFSQGPGVPLFAPKLWLRMQWRELLSLVTRRPRGTKHHTMA